MSLSRVFCLLSFLFLLFFPGLLWAQTTRQKQREDYRRNHINMIACEEYGNITYNGFTTDKIRKAEGEATDLRQLFGKPTSVDDANRIIGAFTYYFGSNSLSFRESELTNIEIKDREWPVTVQGKTIRVGDSLSELRQKFGEDLTFLYRNGISFNCPINEADGLHIELDSNTRKVSKIHYWVNP